MKASEAKGLFAETFREWKEDDAMQWAAALSYYASLALAPLLVILLAIATFVFDEETARNQLLTRIGRWAGPEGREVARTILSSDRATGVWASVTGVVLLTFGATGVFGQLQRALNRMWEVDRKAEGVTGMLRARALGFALVLGIGLLLLASLAVRAVVSGLPAPGWAAHLLDPLLSLAVFTVVLASVFKVLPDVRIRWREVWVGAIVTATLFVVGQIAIGLYLGISAVGSAYGAAGSLVALLVWIYYSAMVFLFGAEFTQVWTRREGRRILPEPGARREEEPDEPEPSRMSFP